MTASLAAGSDQARRDVSGGAHCQRLQADPRRDDSRLDARLSRWCRRQRGTAQRWQRASCQRCFTSDAQRKSPIDLTGLHPLRLDPASGQLQDSERETLLHNIQLVRDTIVFFTALAGAKGLAGHTGGPYDTVPELMIIRVFIDQGAPILPVLFDETGHRVATQSLLSVLKGALRPEQLLHYREYEGRLPGQRVTRTSP